MTHMFDSIDPSQIPAGQDAAGYVDGNWRTFTALHGPHNLSVAVFASDDADALDDEPGDATNAQAPGWVKRELSLGHWKPCLYTSVSNVPALIGTLATNGISRAAVRIWTAHYTYADHRCTHACNQQLPLDFIADATQWTDRSGGRNLDESTIAPDFFNTPTPEEPMLLLANSAGTVVLVAGDKPAVALNAAQYAKFEANGVKAVADDNLFSYYTAQTPPASSTAPQSFNITLSGTGTPA